MSGEPEQSDVPEPEPGEVISEAQHAKYHWGVPISEERQAWLRELADRQREWTKQSEAERRDDLHAIKRNRFEVVP